MKLAVMGIGNAGGKIVDELLQYEYETDRSLITSALAINSARVDLERLERLPRENRFLIGQTDERVKGHGVGSDPDLGAEITRKDQYEIDRALDQVSIYQTDAFLVIAGLGGGTGSGGAPVVASELRDRYQTPVYGLAVLPSDSEGGRASLNAARSFRSFTNGTDNLLLFDNGAWRASQDSLKASYERTNREIAKRIITVLSAGEFDDETVSENAMDSSDIHRTLSTSGVSTIAYAESELKSKAQRGLLGRFQSNGVTPDDNSSDPAMKVNGLIRQAVNSRLTCPAEINTAERSLIVITGPPSSFSRKGLEAGRQWLEQQTASAEVLAGDNPRERAETLSATIVLSNVTDIPRIEALQRQAVDAQENIEKQQSTREDDISALITDEEDKLDPL